MMNMRRQARGGSMNWIPDIMAAGQGDLSSEGAKVRGQELWNNATKGKYIVDQTKYFTSLVSLSQYLRTSKFRVSNTMRRADENNEHKITINQHSIRLNTSNGHRHFLK